MNNIQKSWFKVNINTYKISEYLFLLGQRKEWRLLCNSLPMVGGIKGELANVTISKDILQIFLYLLMAQSALLSDLFL